MFGRFSTLYVKGLSTEQNWSCTSTGMAIINQVLSSLGGSKVSSAFHPSEVDQISTRNSWESAVKSKLSPLSVFAPLSQFNPIHKKRAIKLKLKVKSAQAVAKFVNSMNTQNASKTSPAQGLNLFIKPPFQIHHKL